MNNEETIIQNGSQSEKTGSINNAENANKTNSVNENVIVPSDIPQPSQDNSKKKIHWGQVSVGGVAGIIMGAGSMYAKQAYASSREEAILEQEALTGESANDSLDEENPTKEDVNNETASEGKADTQAATAATHSTNSDVHVYHHYDVHPATDANGIFVVNNTDSGLAIAIVDDDMSFADAFNAARSEVGPGGVFNWHGNVYNTYTVDEWNNMSDEQKQQFASLVEPEISTDETDAIDHQIDYTIDGGDDIHQASLTEDSDITPASEGADDDVVLVGSSTLEDGTPYDAYTGHVEGVEVAIVDIGQNGDPDIIAADINGNGLFADGEVYDAHTGDLYEGDMDMNNLPTSQEDELSNESDDLYTDNLTDDGMDDFVDDASIDGMFT